jgi:superkiller protein 3
MSALVKGKLKAARDAIGKKDYSAAQAAALQALDFESDNYNACVRCALSQHRRDSDSTRRNVFLGLASLELGNHEQSEQVIAPSNLRGRRMNMMFAGVPTCNRGFAGAAAGLAGLHTSHNPFTCAYWLPGLE